MSPRPQRRCKRSSVRPWRRCGASSGWSRSGLSWTRCSPPCCSPTSSDRPCGPPLGDHAGGPRRRTSDRAVALSPWWGVENDTAGDGFFATFDGPARAIRCAQAIIERVRDLGIEVRAGVHTGECELSTARSAASPSTSGHASAHLAAPVAGPGLPDRQGPRRRLRSDVRGRRRARAQRRPRPLAPLRRIRLTP